jgi:hypothetical protein
MFPAGNTATLYAQEKGPSTCSRRRKPFRLAQLCASLVASII